MSNEKLKTEEYQNLGGINSKNSPYITGPMEFLDIVNYDFQTPGSLCQRWGSTQYVGQTFPGSVSALYEFTKLNGASYVFIGHTGGLWFGATTGNSQGASFTNLAATLSSWFMIFTNGYYHQLAATDYRTAGVRVAFQDDPDFMISEGFRPLVQGSATLSINPQIQAGNTLDFVTFQNYMFAADGNMFYKFDGATAYPIGVPPISGVSYTVDTSNISGNTFVMGLSTGHYAVYASYVNNRGFEGQPTPIGIVNTAMTGSTFGATYLVADFYVPAPLSYGISSINFYYYYSLTALTTNTPATGNALNAIGPTNLWSLPYTFFRNMPLSGSTLVDFQFGTTAAGISTAVMLGNNGSLPSVSNQQYLISFGLTLQINPANPPFVTEIDLLPVYPKYLELYQNRLFASGFSGSASTIWYSDIAEPEGFLPDSNFEVRTNDGDVVTAMKAYTTAFYVFKQKSFHVLTGDNPDNFLLRQISDQYGCINNRCAFTFDDYLVFLDQKGVILWNGSRLEVLSNKIQPVFDLMNFSAAQSVAIGAHDKLRNQILFAIPINGSAVNNVTLVYDYLVGAWTKQDGYSPSVFASIQGRNNTKNLFYGGSSGSVNWFGSSFGLDNGVGCTLYYKTRFLHELGDSTQKQFRRFYLNTDAPSATLSFNMNFFQDYGSSVVLNRTFSINQFQNRMDFGISAKSLAYEMSKVGSTIALRVHGFTIESRLQRRV